MALKGFKIPPGCTGSTFSRLDLEGTWTGPVVSGGTGSTQTDITFKRCRVAAAGGWTSWLAKPKWGFRVYNFEDSEIQDCVIERIWVEHGFYANVIGAFTARRCRFTDIGAQGIQVVWRINEGKVDPSSFAKTGVHLVDSCSFKDVGKTRGDGRRSYVISMFGKQVDPNVDNMGPRTFWNCPVRIQDTVIDNGAHNAPILRGAILVEHRPSFELLGGSISHDGPADRPLVLAHQVDRVIISGASFHGAKQIAINGAKEIHVTGCTGSVTLEVDGTKIGPISQDFHWAQ